MTLPATIVVVVSHLFQNLNQIVLLLICLFLPLCLLLWLNPRPSGKKVKNPPPPSPPRLPFIGHLHLLSSLPHRSFQHLSNKYGPLMILHIGQNPTLIVSSAEMAKQIMKTHDLSFADRPVTTFSREVLDGKDIAFANYGEYWRQMKKCCVIDLLSVKRVQSFRCVREDEIANMVGKIKESSFIGKEVNLSDLLLTATNNIISRVTLGDRYEGYAKRTKETMELLGTPSVEDMFPSFGWIDVLSGLRKKIKNSDTAMREFYNSVIEEHLVARKKGGTVGGAGPKDFVDSLLDYQQDSSLGVPFTRDNLIVVLGDMFVAGTDTTYTTLEWAMAELVNHPKVMKRVQEEVRQVIGTKAKVEEDMINQMIYLNCVIKETLRLHPPLAMLIPRMSTTATTIEGYEIPAKIRVMINAWAIARDPKLWDEPNEFIPERFENNEVDFGGKNFEFIPFGAGRRICPGISFGIAAVEVILANLLYLFEWKLPSGENKEVVDVTEVFGLSVQLKFPLRLLPISHTF